MPDNLLCESARFLTPDLKAKWDYLLAQRTCLVIQASHNPVDGFAAAESSRLFL